MSNTEKAAMFVPATSKIKKSTDVSIVWVKEQNPPETAEPLEWMLLTTIPVETAEQALEKIQWYRCRWQIEIKKKAPIRADRGK